MLRFIGGVVVLLFIVGALGALLGNRSSPPSYPTTRPASTSRTAAIAAPMAKTWQTSQSVSAIDDSPTVQLSLEADTAIADRYGGMAYPMLLLWCRENRSGAAFTFGEHFMAELGSYGNVTYRIDQKRAATKHFRESTDNSALMIVGGDAIAFMKALFGGDGLTVRATPFNESALETVFTVAGLEAAVAPLREACHW